PDSTSDLLARAKNSPEIKNLFSEKMRSDYFILIADLEERARLVNDFRPDFTLVIHYDTDDPPSDPTGVGIKPHDATKAFVSGSFAPEEFSSRTARRDFAKHLLDPYEWDGSVKLSRHLTNSISQELGIPL